MLLSVMLMELIKQNNVTLPLAIAGALMLRQEMKLMERKKDHRKEM